MLFFANWSTLLACMVLKFPQILSVMASKSAEGVSLQSVLLEVSGFLFFLRYQIYYNYPMETYLEYPILIAQDAVLLLFLFHYTGSVKNALPYAGISVLQYLCTGMSAASKIIQIQYLWLTKDSGQASALTWSLAMYTSATRIFTTLMTTGDAAVLFRFLLLLILNACVTVMILMYRKKTVKTE
ncbi:hypothetical protein XELAEV_18028052mg [Xenopus laevis]|uniref:Solute carrier family 66 member 3 n=1 Tax=Xenopus laevis TaxID=8355 RepID=A0A974CYX3_XENLA|nr:hypothetical protein XELAEV_18028052mg [Xenopus laevis]